MTKKIVRRFYLLFSATLIVALGAITAFALYSETSRLPLRQYFSSSHVNAVWDWQDPESRSEKQITDIADYMNLHQLNAIYINVGDRFVEIMNDPNTAQKEIHQQQLERALEQYVTALNRRNIQVYAAAGDTSWSDQDKQQIPLFILQAVENYNERHATTRVAGVEFDVEAYNQPGFSAGSNTVKTLVLSDWLDLVDKLSNDAVLYHTKTTHEIELGFAIPYWFDDENGNIPPLTRNYKTGPTLYHLLDRLNTIPKSNIVVMDYRNVAKGNDGIIFHGRTELEYAEAKAPNVRVIIGQEVNNVEPAKITYYGEGMTELSSQISIAENEFNHYGTFGGIAINDLSGLEALSSQ